MDSCKHYLLAIGCWLSAHVWVLAQPTFFLNGSATLASESCYRLTAAPHEVGSIWCDVPLDLRNAFEIRFAVNFGCGQRIGEGIAFVMHADRHRNPNHTGCAGEAMGYARTATCEPLMPSLAVELDVHHNRNQKDPHHPHLSLVHNGNASQPLLAPARLYANGKNVLDCEYHQVRITWKPSKQELQVLVDEQVRLTYKADLARQFFQGAQELSFGFSASTSQQSGMQLVCVQSVTLEIDEIMDQRRRFEESVGIYAHPLYEQFTIDVKFEREQYLEVQLFNSEGKVVYEVPPHLVRKNQYYVSMPGLPSGVYFLTVTNGSQRVSRKIVHVASARA